jgi:hypothetical protein
MKKGDFDNDKIFNGFQEDYETIGYCSTEKEMRRVDLKGDGGVDADCPNSPGRRIG